MYEKACRQTRAVIGQADWNARRGMNAGRQRGLIANIPHHCYLGKRHSGTLVIIYPLLCNISLNIIVKQ